MPSCMCVCDRFPHTTFFAFVGSTQCPSGWRPSLPSAHDTNGNCYVRMPTAKNFTAAEDNCRVQGGHLASIASDNENNIVRNLSNTQIWIGLNDIDEETTFVWTDSSSYNYTMWDRYKFGMEPNNVGNGIKGPANCVRMMPSGKWRDTHCSDKLAYVCEISAQTATTQAPMTAGEMSHSSKTPAAFTVNSIRISCTNLPQINGGLVCSFHVIALFYTFVESCKNAKHATHPATLAPTPNSTANVSESKRRSDSESSAAAVGGGVAAACIAIAIVCVLVVLVLYRRRKVHTNGQSEGWYSRVDCVAAAFPCRTYIVCTSDLKLYFSLSDVLGYIWGEGNHYCRILSSVRIVSLPFCTTHPLL